MRIEYQKIYSINSDRIKDIVKQRGTSVRQLQKKTFLTTERAFRRNLAKGQMLGQTLLEISEALDCTPYYFLEPCPMFDMIPLSYSHYMIQELSIAETRFNFFLIRGLEAKQINSISREEIDRFEQFALDFIDQVKESTEV